MSLFYYFNFERNYDVKVFSLNEKQNFNKRKTESKMENPTHAFRERIFALLVKESWIKNETVMNWSSRKNKECIWKKSAFFFKLYFVLRKIFQRLYFASVYRILNKLSEYAFKIVKSLQYSLQNFANTCVFCEFCEIFKNNFFSEHLHSTGSEYAELFRNNLMIGKLSE